MEIEAGEHELLVTVTDNTALVRDEVAREAWLRETRHWDVTVAMFGDLDGDFDVDTNDLNLLLAAWGPCPDPPDPCPADLDGDGTVGGEDLAALLAAWT